MKEWNYWNGPGIESHFSIDGPFIHALVATLQLPDGHRQFGSSAPPIFVQDLSIFQLYFSILVMAFAASPSGATSVMLCTHFFDQNSAQNEFQLYL